MSVVATWRCTNNQCIEYGIEKPAQSRLTAPVCGRCQQPLSGTPVPPEYPEPPAGKFTVTSGVPGQGATISGTLLGNIAATTETNSIADGAWHVVDFDCTVALNTLPFAPATASITARLSTGSAPTDRPMIMTGTTRAPVSSWVSFAFNQRFCWVRFNANQWEMAIEDPTP